MKKNRTKSHRRGEMHDEGGGGSGGEAAGRGSQAVRDQASRPAGMQDKYEVCFQLSSGRLISTEPGE